MNKRYTDRVDVWMIRKIDAKTFGKQYATIEVLE
jgi:3D (Asp-Asp-Asp) domain-containing protein